MDWIEKLINNKPYLALIFPIILNLFSFFINLAAPSLNEIEDREVHHLMVTINGLEILMILGIMLMLSQKIK